MVGMGDRCKVAAPALRQLSSILRSNESSLRHPAVGAALAARNAVAAEMAVAGRGSHHPNDPAWSLASDALQPELAQPHAPQQALQALAVSTGAPVEVPATPVLRRPTARRRREALELAFWFVVGGLGGLAALAAVRLLESFLR